MSAIFAAAAADAADGWPAGLLVCCARASCAGSRRRPASAASEGAFQTQISADVTTVHERRTGRPAVRRALRLQYGLRGWRGIAGVLHAPFVGKSRGNRKAVGGRPILVAHQRHRRPRVQFSDGVQDLVTLQEADACRPRAARDPAKHPYTDHDRFLSTALFVGANTALERRRLIRGLAQDNIRPGSGTVLAQ